MADNSVIANPGAGGATFASDQIGGIEYPRSKIVWGVDGTATDTAAGAAALPVADGGNSLTIDSTQLPAALGQTTMAASLPVALASNQSALPITDNSGSLTVDGTVGITVGVAATDLAKAEDAGHASGDTGVAVWGVRNDTIGTLVNTTLDYAPFQMNANGSLRVALEASAAAVSGGAGSDANSLRVVLSNANSVAQGATVSTNPVQQGLDGRTSDPTAVTTGQNARAIATALGKQIVKPYAIPGSEWFYAAAAGGLVTTAGVTIKAAGAANVKHYITGIQIMNSHQTISTEVVIRDGASGTVIWRGWAQAAGGGAAPYIANPIPGSAATLLEIAEVTATGTAGVLVNVQGYSGIE